MNSHYKLGPSESSNNVVEDPVMPSSQVNSSILDPVTWDSSADCQMAPYTLHAIIGVVVSAVAIFAIVGNILVLYTYARHSSLRTSSNLLIINLALADLIMSAIDFPIYAISSFKGCWLLGFVGCQVYGASSSVSGLVTINTLTMVSFDRYIVVVHRFSPMHRLAKSTIGITIAIIWLLSITWSVLPLTGFGPYRLEGMGTSCTFNYVDRSPAQKWFFLSLVTFNFFLPLVLITFSYWRIFASVRRIKKEIEYLQREYASGTSRHRKGHREEIKTAITAMIIIGIFCMAWTPYVIIAFIGFFGPPGSITPIMSLFPNILAKISTVSNPILYSIGHPEVRKRMKNVLFGGYNESSWRPTSATVGSGSPAHSEQRNSISMPTYL